VSVPNLHRVSIQGFRAIQRPLELDLRTPRGEPSKMTVLAGTNGSGKTSVLEAILFGLGVEHLIIRDQAERDESLLGQVPEGGRIELDVSLDGAPPTTWVRTTQEHYARDAKGERTPHPAAPLYKGRVVEYFSSRRAPRLVGPVKPLTSGHPPGDAEANRLWKLKQRIIDQRSRRAYAPSRFPWAESREEGWLRKLNDAWARLHHDDGTSIDAEIVNPDAEDLYADLFIMKDGRRLCSIDEASSGEVELLALLGWMILADFTSGILIVDEPELHLHPQWQASILPAIRRLAPEAQLIVASHADSPWDQAFSFQRFLLTTHFDPERFMQEETSTVESGKLLEKGDA
jgi:predicted ATPase